LLLSWLLLYRQLLCWCRLLSELLLLLLRLGLR